MNEIIKVFTVVNGKDDDGFPTETIIEAELFCKVNSASYLDFYSSNQDKVKPTIEFEMRREDFDETRITKDKKHFYPSKVEYDGAEYELIRWRYKDQARAVMICG